MYQKEEEKESELESSEEQPPSRLSRLSVITSTILSPPSLPFLLHGSATQLGGAGLMAKEWSPNDQKFYLYRTFRKQQEPLWKKQEDHQLRQC